METARLGERTVSGEEECRRRMMLCFQLIMVPGTAPDLCDIDHRTLHRCAGAGRALALGLGRDAGSTLVQGFAADG
jgi:hypothetical protein